MRIERSDYSCSTTLKTPLKKEIQLSKAVSIILQLNTTKDLVTSTLLLSNNELPPVTNPIPMVLQPSGSLCFLSKSSPPLATGDGSRSIESPSLQLLPKSVFESPLLV